MEIIATAKLEALSTEQLRALNQQVVGVLKGRYTAAAMQKARQFRVGQQARFLSSKTYQYVTIRIDRINTKTVSGTELDATGRPTHRTWRVSPGLLSGVAT